MNTIQSEKALIRPILLITLLYAILQILIFLYNDTNISRFFWIEHKNIQDLIEIGLPDKSEFTPVIKTISNYHFWILRATVITVMILACYYKGKNYKLYILYKNISISVILLLILASGIITWTLKIIVGKPRPYTGLINYMPFSFSTRFHSFPSGHTTETFSYIIPLVYFFNKKYIYFILLTYGLLTSFTRVILSYHYLTDVIFGIYITTITGFTICYLLNKMTIDKM